MRRITIQAIVTLLLSSAICNIQAQYAFEINLNPEKAFLIKKQGQQFVNCDFYITNLIEDTLRLGSVTIKIYNDEADLIMHKKLSGSGLSPAILTLPNRLLIPNGTIAVFNPFHTFDASLNIKSLQFEFSFYNQDESQKFSEKIMVVPSTELQKTELRLPVLDGPFLIQDGNDYYAHHRRVELNSPVVKMFNVTQHGNRYAYDFCPVNDKYELYENEGKNVEDWFGFGAPVYASADGTVVEIYNEAIDFNIGSVNIDYGEALSNHALLYGNYIIIDHHNGEYSGFMHLKQGSVKFKVGDKVKQGDLIAEIGNSGDASEPHLHYQLTDATTLLNSNGIPVYFTDYKQVLGNTSIRISKGYLDTGEFYEAEY